MLLKFDLGEGLQYMLVEKVQNLVYSGPNTFSRARGDNETIDHYMDCIFGIVEEKNPPKRDGVEHGRSYDCAYWDVHPDGTPSPKLGTKRLWIGIPRKDEVFNTKKVCFTSNDTYYEVATECPVYVCDDSGKTIEKIK